MANTDIASVADVSCGGQPTEFINRAVPLWKMDPLSKRLRAATATLHQQAEGLLDMPALIADRGRYVATLQRFHGVYAPLERALARQRGWDELDLRLQDRSHVGRIECDLAALGCEPCQSESAGICAIASFPHALGALYVLEGSTLGGRVILRHLESNGIDIPPGATSFFAGHGAETGAMWRAFVAKLDAFGGLNPQACRAVQEGAQRAFQAVIAWFDPFCAQMRRGS